MLVWSPSRTLNVKLSETLNNYVCLRAGDNFCYTIVEVER